jgi:hypothetical protein
MHRVKSSNRLSSKFERSISSSLSADRLLPVVEDRIASNMGCSPAIERRRTASQCSVVVRQFKRAWAIIVNDSAFPLNERKCGNEAVRSHDKETSSNEVFSSSMVLL